MKQGMIKGLLALVIIAATVGAFFVGKNLPADTQLELYSALRDTSAIVFGVMGAWIAIIYPESLSKIYRSPQRKDAESEVKSVGRLIKPMIVAAVIVASTLIAQFVAPILRSFDVLTPIYSSIRGLSFSFLIILLAVQLVTILEVMLVSFTFRREVRLRQAEDSFEKGFMAGKEKNKPNKK